MTNQPLILGSTSVYRRELLERLQIPFDTAAPDIDETRLDNESAADMVLRLSHGKALAVAADHPDALIIASDQCALLGDQVLGKPGDHPIAVQQLSACSGKKVEFLTGLCLYNAKTSQYQLELVPFSVEFRELSHAEIDNYLHREKPYNCAGSFKSEGLGISLFKALHGEDPNALIGLPLIKLTEMLRREAFVIPAPL
ncbi:MAG: Maf-like protein BWK73_52915 [uncultured Thiotrichaceae bacterium]|uniref:7-methyl-GTP pyrophosphatase n=1 Tax=uncultured Thiotrichaceae bacterium TaxID=298394 RepID=A0A6S6U1C2_9GAMM|nr:MAG: Maf-like protein BWK73_52915 [uncultured Thiotrichaceae bacterium]